MRDDLAIRVKNLSKCYQIYDNPQDRLKQSLISSFQRLVGKAPTQYFREFWALKDISFEVKKGETVGIIGRNGSGKSTLLQIICGTLTATGGEVEASGRIAALLELGSGFNPEFTGRENILLNGAILGVDKELIQDRIEEVISFSGLRDHIDQPLKTYSSGMQARLAFSAAIHVDPTILVVDEALSVGDAGFQLKCMLRMREMQERGVTILFVSHDTGSVVRLCDRAILIEKGRLIPGDQSPIKCVKLYETIARNVDLLRPRVNDARPNTQSYSSELQGIEETRMGSREAEYVNVQFLGDDGCEREVFNSGEDIEIRALIRSERAFPKVVSGFTLKNRNGVDVWGDNTIFADYDMSLSAGLHWLSYRFKLYVPAGDYFLYIGLADISGERTELDQRWPVRRLSVVSSRRVLGYTFSPAAIELVHVSREFI